VEVAPRLHNYSTYRPLHNIDLHIPAGARPAPELIRQHFETSRRVFEHN